MRIVDRKAGGASSSVAAAVKEIPNVYSVDLQGGIRKHQVVAYKSE